MSDFGRFRGMLCVMGVAFSLRGVNAGDNLTVCRRTKLHIQYSMSMFKNFQCKTDAHV